MIRSCMRLVTIAAMLSLVSCSAWIVEKGRVPGSDLVDLAVYAPEIAQDLRYKGSDHAARRPLYHRDFPALLNRGTARRLKKVNRLLAKGGLRLVVWDAFRPQEVQRALWDACGHDDRFVANPDRHPSLHSHGCAVDVSLQYLDGKPAAVPTRFDDFSAKAHSDFVHPDPEVREHMRRLKEAIWASGMGTLPHEWWHFMDQDYRKIPVVQTDSLPLWLQQMIRDPLRR